MTRGVKQSLALLLALALLTAAGAAAADYPYRTVLDMTLAGIMAEEDPEDEAFNPFCRLMTAPEGVTRPDLLGYAFVDLDGDGSEELLIGQTGLDEDPDGMILDVWTMQGGEPALVCRGWDRYRFYLTAGEAEGSLALVTEGSDSAWESQFEYGVIRDGAFVAEHRLVYDGEAAAPWTLDGEPCEEEAARQLLELWQSRRLTPPLQPFSTLLEDVE